MFEFSIKVQTRRLMHQSTIMYHSQYLSLEDGLEASFLDVSKAFDKLSHEGLLFKLKQNGISGNL